ncbi:multiple cyclophane-containing RiPP AmcA [Micromonospora sp. CPCC 206060]|uniref:multiple cyclophane-containing RiPP AmcA n=1 Tax=Micromonospora sp. CPCC 206060 TaxID=3122406 RepID=UPI002FEECB85
MPENTSREPHGETGHRAAPRVGGEQPGGIADRVHRAASGLTALLYEAEQARRLRSETAGGDGASAVCAWNHFENIPTFYNWNNRPR